MRNLKIFWKFAVLLLIAFPVLGERPPSGPSAGLLEPRMIPRNFPGRCRRAPLGTKTSGDKGYYIHIFGNPDKYVPGQNYTITLHGMRSPAYTQKFIAFMLIVEHKEKANDISSRPDVGTFYLLGDALSQFSQECPNAIIQASLFPKSEVQAVWKAPPAGTGCVIFKATVQENKEVWFMDDGRLTRELCEEELENRDEQPPILEVCGACEEAKYELTFEGMWSRHTHPKDFPTYEWLTHFSDIIGASHTGNFTMWDYGGFASDGVKSVAETGNTKKLESELKAESHKIRTIIKARGLWYPNVTGKTFAVFRVDQHHHLVSLLTKLSPSPDWILGVSSLELCLKNRSWVMDKVMNLYPWDAGTNSGITYTSSQPTIHQERIRRITSSSPNLEEAPFYDPSGDPMKPVARLILTRRRVYEKSCDDNVVPFETSSSSEDDAKYLPVECRVTEWTEFTPCSASCGLGTRMRSRHYYNSQLAEIHDCTVQLVDKDVCENICPGPGKAGCSTSEWEPWSDCSATCGRGIRTRTRKYITPQAKQMCSLDLIQKESCVGHKAECVRPTAPLLKNNNPRLHVPVSQNEQQKMSSIFTDPDPMCAMTQWSEWSPCTVTCGEGQKLRTRLYTNPSAHNLCNMELSQKEPCTAEKLDCEFDENQAQRICRQPKEVGPCRGYFPRWYYDSTKAMCIQFIYGGCRGNENNFEKYADCNKMCEAVLKGNGLNTGPSFVRAPISVLTPLTETSLAMAPDKQQPINCVVTQWSEWSPCSQTCGDGRRERRRMIKVNPEYGGTPCPAKLVMRRKCKENKPCPWEEETGHRRRTIREAIRFRNQNEEVVDCVLSPWSEWTTCSKTCGAVAVQQRTRTVIQLPHNRGTPCGSKTEKKYCVLQPCPFRHV